MDEHLGRLWGGGLTLLKKNHEALGAAPPNKPAMSALLPSAARTAANLMPRNTLEAPGPVKCQNPPIELTAPRRIVAVALMAKYSL